MCEKKSWTTSWNAQCGCALLATAAMGSAAFAQNAPGGPPDTIDGCWTEYIDHMGDCCSLGTPVDRDSCYDTANDGLQNCLDNLDDEQTPPYEDCWDMYYDRVVGCGTGPCGTTESEKACNEGANTFYNWCIGVVPTNSFLLPQWEWGAAGGPQPVFPGAPYTLRVSVHNPLVTGVTFFVIQSDAQSGVTTIERVGEARAQSNFAFVADTRDWPVADDAHIGLVARTELGEVHGPIAQVFVDVMSPGDFNHDGKANVLDFVVFQEAWANGDERADINDDGALNMLDFIAFQALFADGSS